MPKISATKPRKPDMSKNLRKKSVNKKAPKSKKKPEWDPTSNDLNVHKLSRPELESRHKAHQSKNIEAAKHELYDKAKESYDLNNSGSLRPSPSVSIGNTSRRMVEAKKLLALQQSLHGRELHDVLLKSDRTMRVVKDLFGDDPKRYSCQPNVTIAPHVKESKQILEQAISESHINGPPPTAHASPGGIRDKSVQEIVLRKPALNELSDVATALDYGAGGDASTSDHTPNPTQSSLGGAEHLEKAPFKSALDLKRFQKLVQERKVPAIPRQLRDTAKQSGNSEESVTSRPNESDSIDSISITDVSELSSIPVHPDLAMHRGQEGNVTVDSEVSSLYNVTSHAHPQPTRSQQSTVPSQQGGVVNQQHPPQPTHSQQSVTSQQGGVVNQRHPLPSQQRTVGGHPLYLSHKVHHQHRPHHHGGHGNDLPCSTKTSKIHTNLAMLEKLVGDLEQELSVYEEVVSPSASDHTPTPHTPSVMDGDGRWVEVMSSLLRAVRKMMRHLRQSEVQLKGEVVVRGQFLQTLHEQQDLMDVLTADLLSLRKENAGLRQDIAAIKEATAREMADIKANVADIHIAMTGLPHTTSSTSMNNQPTAISRPLVTSRTEPAGSEGKIWSPPNLSLDNTLTSDFGCPEKSSVQPVMGEEAPSQDDADSTLREEEEGSFGSEARWDVSRAMEGSIGSVSGGSQQGVVYAQVSPLSYNPRSRGYARNAQVTSDPRVSSGPMSVAYTAPPLPARGPVPHPAVQSKPHLTNPNASEDFLQTLNAPAPPPLSVALQVPSAPPPLSAKISPYMTTPSQPPLAHQKVHQNDSSACNVDGHGAPNIATDGIVSVVSTCSQPTSVSVVSTKSNTTHPATSYPAAYAATTPATVGQSKLTRADLTTATDVRADAQGRVNVNSGLTGKQNAGGIFDVGRLLDSLQQLNRTQDQLQATADKLRSLPPATMPSQTSIASSHGTDVMSNSAGGLVKKSSPTAANARHVGTVDLSLSCISSLPGDVTQPESQFSVEERSTDSRVMTQESGVSDISSTGDVIRIERVSRTHARQGASDSSPAIIKRKVAFEKESNKDIPLIRTDESHACDDIMGDMAAEPSGSSSAFKAFDVSTEKTGGSNVVLSRDKTDKRAAGEKTWFALSSHLTLNNHE